MARLLSYLLIAVVGAANAACTAAPPSETPAPPRRERRACPSPAWVSTGHRPGDPEIYLRTVGSARSSISFGEARRRAVEDATWRHAQFAVPLVNKAIERLLRATELQASTAVVREVQQRAQADVELAMAQNSVVIDYYYDCATGWTYARVGELPQPNELEEVSRGKSIEAAAAEIALVVRRISGEYGISLSYARTLHFAIELTDALRAHPSGPPSPWRE